MSGFTKLDNGIFKSSIWCADTDTRIVWITLLVTSDAEGLVETSVPGLARIANVDVDACERALDYLTSPDPDSRSKEYEGRRLEQVDGGFVILNKTKYRDKQYSRAEYMREWRKNHPVTPRNTPLQGVTECNSALHGVTQEEEEEEEEEKKEGEIKTPPVNSLSDQIRKDRTFGKCCVGCGSSSKADSGRMVWRESLPWCQIQCYDFWVKAGRPKS